ncbi:MAG: pyridoxine 5'-phosphate synthase [Gammaproteobacteria bacterium]|nr:pyridoxine 5'-phosphate synthase [Gammaproteobacteria bacterium]NNC96555.1 pyridoxine 5'-phosphate synthase [Gammaproteobacteria bacterium]NNM12914.1 pyridoxine 5'-phosphate synthase [Gammaproteobacteria bacterium]
MTRLGVNIDHVATLREVRHASYPSVVEAASAAIRGGADGITVHLREDRRHIQDHDVSELKNMLTVPMNLEISISPEMVDLACEYLPEHVCLVPERREELTTEGGLDVLAYTQQTEKAIQRLQKEKIQVSLFIDPDLAQITQAARIGADVIEIHTGHYANTSNKAGFLALMEKAVAHAIALGLEVHAGHGLTLENLPPLASMPEIAEFNIGHAIVARALQNGLEQAVRDYKQCIVKHAVRSL